jgi:protoporphyrinogen oxidase
MAAYLSPRSERGFMDSRCDENGSILVLGGGLTGLSAAYILAKAGLGVTVFESDSAVGGLSKTIVHDGFRFDLGGHRFFTKDREVDAFVRGLIKDELVTVRRTSKIYLHGKYFDYPLRPLNAIFGLGIPTTLQILSDYGFERVKRLVKEKRSISLEDWVVKNFGRTMFDIYFKEYSEKVWGIECSRISAEWVAQRIKGLSLGKAIKNAFFKFSGTNLPTLADSFIYPQLGIGRISERLAEKINESNKVFTDTCVERINYSGSRIDSIAVKGNPHSQVLRGEEFISSLPLTALVKMLNPLPPRDILDAASRLKFRDLVVVAVMVDRKRVTDQTWIYIPEQEIPFGRIHEPTNWSDKMAPEGKTLVVMEFFSFRGDRIWNESDRRLTDITIENLERLGFLSKNEVLDSAVVRVPKAYPLFDVGYKDLCDEIYEYLGKFKNLHLAGRCGMFRYYNMDHAIASGLQTAAKIIRNSLEKGEFRGLHDKAQKNCEEMCGR